MHPILARGLAHGRLLVGLSLVASAVACDSMNQPTSLPAASLVPGPVYVRPLGTHGPVALATPFGPIADTVHSEFQDLKGFAAPHPPEARQSPNLSLLRDAGSRASDRYVVRLKSPSSDLTRDTEFRAPLSAASFKDGLTAFQALGAEILLIFNHHGSALVRIPPRVSDQVLLSPYVDDIVADGPTDKVPDSDSIHWSITKVNVQPVWDSTRGKGEMRVVHMIETQYTTHADHNDNTCTPYDQDSCADEAGTGHGTKVMGTFTARLNGWGTVGAAPAPSYVYLWDAYTDSAYTRSSLSWAYNQVLGYVNQVLNMSYSGFSSQSWEATLIADLWSDGAILVASAGNDTTNTVKYPAGYSNVLGVAGSNSDDSRASGSNYGSHVDLVAPFCVYTTLASGGYGDACGNSFSTPLVAGAAAIVWSIHYTESNSQIVSRLTSAAHALGWSGSGYGLVDAFEAAY